MIKSTHYTATNGAKGGKATSALKAAACAKNGAMPCHPGKRRGWPKGKKRKPVTSEAGSEAAS